MPSAAPTDAALDQAAVLAALRAHVARLEGSSQARPVTDAILICHEMLLSRRT